MPEQNPSMFDVQHVDLAVVKDILIRTNSLEALKKLEEELQQPDLIDVDEAYKLAQYLHKETRSEKTWYRQLQMVENSEGFVVCSYLKDQLISAGLFSISNRNCDYQVSVSRRDMFDNPLFHSLMLL